MYLMTTKSSVRGRSYEYLRLCESVWKNGRSARRIVATLGRKDQLEPHLERLFELCRGHKPDAAQPIPLRALRYGPFLALRCLWQELRLPQLLGPLSDRVLVLVANRLTAPGSEHALADWLRSYCGFWRKGSVIRRKRVSVLAEKNHCSDEKGQFGAQRRWRILVCHQGGTSWHGFPVPGKMGHHHHSVPPVSLAAALSGRGRGSAGVKFGRAGRPPGRPPCRAQCCSHRSKCWRKCRQYAGG